jgi:hypothetical protein
MHKYINFFLSIGLAYSIYLIYDLDKKIKSNTKKRLETKSSQTDQQKTISIDTKSSQTDQQKTISTDTKSSQTDQQKTMSIDTKSSEDSELECDYEHLENLIEYQGCEKKIKKTYLQKLFLM